MGLPVEVNNLMLGSLGGYTVGRSLRFRSSASAYLSRTPASAGNRTTWTWSAWVKRGILGTSNQSLFSADTNSGAGNSSSYIWFTSSDTLAISIAAGTYYLNSSSVYRDPSAWYHIVVAYDTTQATASNRLKLHVNGVQLTAFGTATYPTQNYTSNINNNVLHSLSARVYQSPTIDTYTDCYLAEVNFIDGQALTPSSFGAYDTNGVWQPKKYSGTYGTNGFYLPFSNTTSTTTLVQDSSGNGNNWTPNNISLTAGTTYDSMIDSPTNSASSSNYAVGSPLDKNTNMSPAEGNLYVTKSGAGYGVIRGTIGVSSGKWYWEGTAYNFGPSDGSGGRGNIGIQTASGGLNNYIGADAYGWMYNFDGLKLNNGSSASYGATYTASNVIGVALDMDAGTITFYKNGTSQGTAYSSLTGTMFPAFSADSTNASSGWYINFGQRPFSYTPPSGFKALNTYNLPAPSIANGAQYMAATLYTGNGSTQTINNSSGFYPDFNWIKNRSNVGSHVLVNSVVGGTKQLFSNLTDAEQTNTNITNGISSSGIALGNNTAGTGSTNQNTDTYVAWQWLAGAGTTSTNTSGSITSTVSVNATAAFSVATFTAPSSGSATVGHGLGVAPSFIIMKTRAYVLGWYIYHQTLGGTKYLLLNENTAVQTGSVVWNNTNPTSSVFSLGNGFATTGNMVAYCFSAVAGYSAFGSISGSSSDVFTYLGFRPRFVIIKRTDNLGDWNMWDSSRNTYNVVNSFLNANQSNAESTFAQFDFLSNGLRFPSGSLTAGASYIYMAWAENPFNLSRAR